jgi:hypothetical protein
MIPLRVPEVRRLILAMSGPHQERGFRLRWSLWRRAHQAVAKRCHTAKRDLLRPRPPGRAQPGRSPGAARARNHRDATSADDALPPHRHPVGVHRGVATTKRRPW